MTNIRDVDPNATVVFETTIPKGSHAKGATFNLVPTQPHWKGFLFEFLSVQAIPMSANPFSVKSVQNAELISGFSTIVTPPNECLGPTERSETPFQTVPRAPERARLDPFQATAVDFRPLLRIDEAIETSIPVRIRCFFQGKAHT